MKILLLFSLLLSSGIAFAQDNALSLKRYESKPILGEQFKALHKLYSGISFSLGYERTSFLNSTFANNLDLGRIKHKLGYYFSARIMVYPFSLDVNRFSLDFNTENLSGWTLNDGSAFHHRGWEYALSFYPMFYGKIARILAPYGGVGYQFSHLCWNCKVANQTEEEMEPGLELTAVKTSAPVWKAGTVVKLGGCNCWIEAEYKQTLSLKNRYALGGWRVGFAFLLDAGADGGRE